MNDYVAACDRFDRACAAFGEQQPERTPNSRRSSDAFRDLVGEVLAGDATSPFWQPTNWASGYCNEQELEVFLAVRRACALIGATPAQRWGVVEDALRDLAIDYAEHIAKGEA